MKESKRENLNQKIALKMKSISQRIVLLMLNFAPFRKSPKHEIIVYNCLYIW